ncbi:MAG: group III truncated hemoglobin [Pseudomonadota bacterium]
MYSQYLKIENGKAVKPDGYDSSNIVHIRRLDHQRRVLDLGLSPTVLSSIVDEFYYRVRSNPVLAPIFEAKVGNNWDQHLVKMKSFWISVALNAGTYSGKPVTAHIPLNNVQPWHFDIWLGLFRQTVLDVTGSTEAVDFMMVRAEKMANNLKGAMFGCR